MPERGQRPDSPGRAGWPVGGQSGRAPHSAPHWAAALRQRLRGRAADGLSAPPLETP